MTWTGTYFEKPVPKGVACYKCDSENLKLLSGYYECQNCKWAWIASMTEDEIQKAKQLYKKQTPKWKKKINSEENLPK